MTIEIEHCINADSVDNTTLTFARADTNSSPPYVFKKLVGGRFGRNSWGTISLSKFSILAVFCDGYFSSDYLAHLLSSRRSGGPGIYRVILIASFKLSTYKEVCCMHVVLCNNYEISTIFFCNNRL